MAAQLVESAEEVAARHVIILTGQDGSGQAVKEADDEINALIHARVPGPPLLDRGRALNTVEGWPCCRCRRELQQKPI